MSGSVKKILMLADDDADDRELFGEAIGGIDPSILCYYTENGKELLTKLISLSALPHIIFLDINMPVMDGWECLKMLRNDERYNAIQVIMYSTSSVKKDVDQALKMGANCFFTKPIAFTDLRFILSLIINNAEPDFYHVLSGLNDHQKSFIFCRDQN